MADLDQLLRGDLASLAADGAAVPDFAPLERRGVRRRRTRSAAVTLSAAAAVLAVGLAAFQLGSGDRTAPPVTPTPTPTPTVEQLTADEIVDDPASTAAAVVVAPEDPRIRAVVWRLCKNERCTRMYEAVAVTDDGFKTRATLVLHDFPQYVGSGVFAVIGLGPPRLLHPDGSVVEVTGPLSDPRPVEPGEVIVSFGSGVLRWAAVNPTTGRAHAVTVPEGVAVLRVAPGGRLAGESFGQAAYTWSDDGGRTWSSTPLATDGSNLTVTAASRGEDPVAVLEGGDGATLFPLQYVHRSTDGGATFERIPLFDDPMAYGQNAGVLPDGRLLLNIEAWSDDQPEMGNAHPVGLHVSNGPDWSDLRPVEGAQPYAIEQPDVFATSEGLLIVYGRAGVASTDAGQTWQEFRVR